MMCQKSWKRNRHTLAQFFSIWSNESYFFTLEFLITARTVIGFFSPQGLIHADSDCLKTHKFCFVRLLWSTWLILLQGRKWVQLWLRKKASGLGFYHCLGAIRRAESRSLNTVEERELNLVNSFINGEFHCRHFSDFPKQISCDLPIIISILPVIIRKQLSSHLQSGNFFFKSCWCLSMIFAAISCKKCQVKFSFAPQRMSFFLLHRV